MKLSLVIAALRLRCPVFAERVAGAAEFKPLPDVGKFELPCAWVIPLDDNTGDNKSQTDYWQDVTDGFAVVVVFSNASDERGQASSDAVEEIRSQLWQALLGWEVDENYHPIQYDGGTLLELNRHALYYQFEFSAKREISAEETRQWDDLEALQALASVGIDIDFIRHETQKPDGNIEHHVDINFPDSE